MDKIKSKVNITIDWKDYLKNRTYDIKDLKAFNIQCEKIIKKNPYLSEIFVEVKSKEIKENKEIRKSK